MKSKEQIKKKLIKAKKEYEVYGDRILAGEIKAYEWMLEDS